MIFPIQFNGLRQGNPIDIVVECRFTLRKEDISWQRQIDCSVFSAGPHRHSGATTGYVTIPTGFASVTIVVTPGADTNAERVELATLQVTSASGYAVGTPEKETIAIMDPGVVHIPSNDDLTIAGNGCGSNGSGNHNVCFCIPGLGCFGYMSDANPHPTVAVDALIQRTRGTATLSSVEAALNLGGIQKTVYYNGASISQTDLYRLAVQVDAS